MLQLTILTVILSVTFDHTDSGLKSYNSSQTTPVNDKFNRQKLLYGLYVCTKRKSTSFEEWIIAHTYARSCNSLLIAPACIALSVLRDI